MTPRRKPIPKTTEEIPITTACAYCKRKMDKTGSPIGEPLVLTLDMRVSHGVCLECLPIVLRQIEDLKHK